VAIYSRGRQATDNNTKRRMRFACWITKATNTRSEYVILLFHCSNDFAKAPRCYLIRSLSLLCVLIRGTIATELKIAVTGKG
jgi:hypothetical protein